MEIILLVERDTSLLRSPSSPESPDSPESPESRVRTDRLPHLIFQVLIRNVKA